MLHRSTLLSSDRRGPEAKQSWRVDLGYKLTTNRPLLFLPVLLGKEDTFFISSSPQFFPHKILGSRVSIFSGISSAFLSPCNTTPDTLFLVISFSPCKITPDPLFLVKIQPFKGGCLSTVSCTVLLLQGHLLSSDGKEMFKGLKWASNKHGIFSGYPEESLVRGRKYGRVLGQGGWERRTTLPVQVRRVRQLRSPPRQQSSIRALHFT